MLITIIYLTIGVLLLPTGIYFCYTKKFNIKEIKRLYLLLIIDED